MKNWLHHLFRPLVTIFILLTSCSLIETIKTVPNSNEILTTNTGQQVIAQWIIYTRGSDKSEDLMWELIYVGKENNFIRLLYREYFSYHSESLLKSDYTVEYKYDLNESNVIKFRDNEIEIINSTPSTLEYIIRSTSVKYTIETPCKNRRLEALLSKKQQGNIYPNTDIKLTEAENAELDSLQALCDEYESNKK